MAYALAVYETSPAEAVNYCRQAAARAHGDPGMLVRCASLMYDLGEFDDARTYVKEGARHVGEGVPLIADMTHLVGKLALEKDSF